MATAANPSLSFSTTDYSLRNRLYAVIIKQKQDGLSEAQASARSNPDKKPRYVVGSIPESFQIDQQVDWNPAMAGGLVKNETAGNLIAAFTGNRLIAQVGTMQVWQGSGNETQFTLTFELRAWSDPRLDVMEPLKTLMSMSLPSLDDTGFMKSPGAYIQPDDFIASMVEAGVSEVTQLTSKYLIQDKMKNVVSISIGKWAYFDNVIITGVQHTVMANTPYRGTSDSYFNPDSEPADSGLPQGVSVTISFRTMFMMTEEDISSLINNGQSTQIEEGDFVINDDQPERIDLFDPLAT